MQDIINGNDTLLVDVRTPAEVAEQSVPGAENIPLDTVPENLATFKEHQGPVVVFCRSGNRSEQAKNWLKQNGVDEVHNAGGIGDVLVHKM